MMLTEFLLARIAEDEVVARNSALQLSDGRRADWFEASSGVLDTGDDLWPIGDSAISRHAERFDPARVLAECEAKRRIVEEHPEMPVSKGVCSCIDHWPCATLRALAAIYADHPDYREAWKP